MKINFNTQSTNLINYKNSSNSIIGIPFTGLFHKKDELNITAKVTQKKLDCHSVFRFPHKIQTKFAQLYTMGDDISDRRIPKELKEISKKHNVNPKEDLFIVSGLNENNKSYTMFNAFYFDTKTRKNMMQIFYLESKTEQLSDLQKQAHAIFYDISSRQTLCKNSMDNPFQGFSENLHNEPNGFVKLVGNWTEMIEVDNPMPESCLYNEKGEVNPVIYAADGHCTKYKVFNATSLKDIKKNI